MMLGKIIFVAIILFGAWNIYKVVSDQVDTPEQTYTGNLDVSVSSSDSYSDDTDVDVLYYPNVNNELQQGVSSDDGMKKSYVVDFLILVGVAGGITVLVIYGLVSYNIIGFVKKNDEV